MLDFLARKRVSVGTAFMVLVFLIAAPKPAIWALGLSLALFGETVRTWSSGYLCKNQLLATAGPYAMLRNPLYFGSFFLGLGIVLMSGNWWMTGIYPLLFLTIYLRQIQQEEQHLLGVFGDKALRYFRHVPRLIPDLSGYRPPLQAWDLRRVICIHREWINWLLLAGFATWFHTAWRLRGLLALARRCHALRHVVT